MNDRKVAIYLFGYSCSGKSTTETLVRARFPGLYVIDYDVQKMQLSGYHRHKDSAYIKVIDLGFFEVICKTGKSVLLTSNLLDSEAEYLAYAKISDTYGYDLLSFEFRASRDTLISRHRGRVEYYKSIGEGDSVKTEEEYLDRINRPYYIPENTVTFDTSDTSSEQIANEILLLSGRAVS